MQRKEALHGVCARMEKVTDGGKSPPITYHDMVAGEALACQCSLEKGWDVLRSMEYVTFPEPQNFGPGDLNKG